MNTARLRDLTHLMHKQGLDVLLLHNTDEYQSGSIHENRQRVKWLCGFTGSNAFLIICKDGKSQFFTDSRYIIQSAMELNADDYDVHDFCDLAPATWLEKNIHKYPIVSYEGDLFTLSQISRYKKFQPKLVQSIMIDKLWDRPTKVHQRVREHPKKFAGFTSREKRAQIASTLLPASSMLMTDIDSISWLLNIRNMEFINNPSVLSRAILYRDGSAQLFVEGVDQVHIHDKDVSVCEMSQLPEVLTDLCDVVVDARTVPMSIFNLVKGKVFEIKEGDLCTLPKATKNAVEIQGMIKAHVRDGAAMANFLYWLHSELAHSGRTITELEAAGKVSEFRRAQELFVGESFEAISGFGGNGAIVHYRANKNTNKVLEQGGLYLLDSGGQYLDGTTDITRTVAIGTPSREHIERFTMVLKGHIALARVVFPTGTSGGNLDVLARQYLWEKKLNYGHGTGHGVGSFLSVHEGPQAISQGSHVELLPGMVLSNEPGYYKQNEYGIRIENLMCVEDCGEGFRNFRQLTCVPLDKGLIDRTMLNPEEIEYVNNYHNFVYDAVAQHVDADVRSWLKSACEAI
ncbi:MAG: aminopeptidase P family protein [Anaplasma sp.]